MKNVDIIKQKITPVLRQHDVVKAAVFGSYVRGEENKESDIDILIEYAPGTEKTLFDLVELRDLLKELLQKDVDLLTENSISPYLRNRIMQEKMVIM